MKDKFCVGDVVASWYARDLFYVVTDADSYWGRINVKTLSEYTGSELADLDDRGFVPAWTTFGGLVRDV